MQQIENNTTHYNQLKKMDIFEFSKSKNYWAEVDWWYPMKDERFFTHTKNAIILPVSQFFGTNSSMLDTFILTPRRCYNSYEIRDHICRYLNYLEKFYDK